MTLLVVLHPLGIALGVAFVATLAAVLWWMLRLPPPVSPEVARAVHSVGALRRIMVPIMDRLYSERAVELACRLASGPGAEIVLAYIVEVPRSMPLGVRLPAVEARARTAIQDGLAIVRRHHLTGETTVLRSREAGEGIARAAREYGVDLVVLGVRCQEGVIENIFSRAMALLLRRAPCEVIIDRVPQGALPVEEPGRLNEEARR